MMMVKVSDNFDLMVPDNDTQEFWQLEGRVEALRCYLLNNRVSAASTVFVDDVLAMLGVMSNEKAGATNTGLVED